MVGCHLGWCGFEFEYSENNKYYHTVIRGNGNEVTRYIEVVAFYQLSYQNQHFWR